VQSMPGASSGLEFNSGKRKGPPTEGGLTSGRGMQLKPPYSMSRRPARVLCWLLRDAHSFRANAKHWHMFHRFSEYNASFLASRLPLVALHTDYDSLSRGWEMFPSSG
jgi:hypothetical protein